jgi:hypothetical protein
MRSDRAASPAGEAVRKEELMRSERRHHRIGDGVHALAPQILEQRSGMSRSHRGDVARLT